MCLKPKLSQIKHVIKNNKDEYNFLNYLLVQELGIYNMLDVVYENRLPIFQTNDKISRSKRKSLYYIRTNKIC